MPGGPRRPLPDGNGQRALQRPRRPQEGRPREKARAREGLLPGQYRSGPELLPVKTDLLYLELVAPELVTPARERES